MHGLQILLDGLQSSHNVAEISKRYCMRIFGELFGNDSAARLKDVVQINFKLVEISSEKVIDLLLGGAQVQFHILQAGFHVARKLLDAVLHVLVRHKRADHAEPVICIECTSPYRRNKLLSFFSLSRVPIVERTIYLRQIYIL